MNNSNSTENNSRRGVPVWVVLLAIPVIIGAFFLGTQQVQKVQYIEKPQEEDETLLTPAGPVAQQPAAQPEAQTEEENSEEEAKPLPRRSELPEEMVREALMPQQKPVSLKFASLPKVKKLDYYTVQQEKEKLAQAERAAEREKPSEEELRARADQERFSKVQTAAVKAPAGYFEAARKGDNEKLQSFLADGIDINAADATGSTALMLAAFRGNGKTVEMLLQKGADRTLKNRFQQTAEDMAKDFPEILNLLKQTEKK